MKERDQVRDWAIGQVRWKAARGSPASRRAAREYAAELERAREDDRREEERQEESEPRGR